MFQPHITVACVVQAQDLFLLVEESPHGRPVWNQPAGHLKASETLVQAAQRELWEETGIHATPQSLLKIFQWDAPDSTPFLRFTFAIDLSEPLQATPQDADIDRCLWMPAQQIFNASNLRSPLVAESVRCYLEDPQRYPLELLRAYEMASG